VQSPAKKRHFPAIFLTVMIVALTFTGDGIRDAVDPTMSQ